MSTGGMYRIIRNRLRFGKRYRLQWGDWYPVTSPYGPKRRFHVYYEDCYDTRESALIAMEQYRKVLPGQAAQ